FATFNARSETVSEKATFRNAWNHGQRCVIPAVGYYEWKKEGQSKQPYFIKPTQHAPMFLGGLYEPHRNGIPASCTIITHTASKVLSPIHPRTPTMIHPKDISKWLEGSEDLQTTSEVNFAPVSSAVNNAKNDGPELINPL
ncbi:MAG: SOS response-associated peptidase, partial [Planctomycetes bacterium]|nr:SOS response-associated peptidase [Planctomycetota bacterium]